MADANHDQSVDGADSGVNAEDFGDLFDIEEPREPFDWNSRQGTIAGALIGLVIGVGLLLVWQPWDSGPTVEPIVTATDSPAAAASPSADVEPTARVWGVDEIPPKEEITIEYLQRVMDALAELENDEYQAVIDYGAGSPEHLEAARKQLTEEMLEQRLGTYAIAAEEGEFYEPGDIKYVVTDLVGTPGDCVVLTTVSDVTDRFGPDAPSTTNNMGLVPRSVPSRELTAWILDRVDDPARGLLVPAACEADAGGPK